MKILKLKPQKLKTFLRVAKKADNRFDNYKPKDLKGFFRDSKFILIAEQDKNIVGYMGLKKFDDDNKVRKFLDLTKFVAVMWIGTASEVRNKGVGSKLLKVAEKYVKVWKKKGIWLDCRKDKIPFYTHNKYSILGYFIKKNKRQYVLIKNLK